MLDILCLGDAKIDIFLQIQPENPHVSLDEDRNGRKKIEINFGEKIYIEKYVIETGGNAANTSVGVSRLGFNAGICAEIGNDEFSQKILNNLKFEKVNTQFLLQTDSEKSSFSVILSYKGDRTIFSEHTKRDHNFKFDNLNSKILYITSLGKNWENAYKNALEYAKTNNIKLAFNPGTLQIEEKSKVVMDILERTDFLFVNKEEAEEILYGEKINFDTKNIERILFGLKSLGAKNVMITDSNNGSYLKDLDDNNFYLGIAPSDVLEKTGAGDAYTGGFLAGILNGASQKESMVWGAVNSASVIEKIGAQEGLLTRSELLSKIKSLHNFFPKPL